MKKRDWIWFSAIALIIVGFLVLRVFTMKRVVPFEEAMEHISLVDGEKAVLTPKEYELLFYFVRNQGLALTREKLLYDVWGFDFYGDDRTVDTHVKMLRGNLKEYRKFIVTLRGLGYKFEVPADQ